MRISMRSIQFKGLFLLVLVLLLLFLLSVVLNNCYLTNSCRLSVSVTLDLSSPIGASQFSPGLTVVDTSLDYQNGTNDRLAVNHARSLLKQMARYVNTNIMAWGLDDPWPDPTQSEPTDWNSLDTRMGLILDTGAVPVITLTEAPWWMKGQLQSDGTTRSLTSDEEWSDIAYSSPLLDKKMYAWLHLVQRVAERYMVPPYNVRYFQVWNELKGYYNPKTNAYDYTTSPGDPSSSVAQHGYTDMYNQVYERLNQVASSLHISPSSIQVGGPYVPMDTWSSTLQSDASSMTKAYGTYDQRPLDVVHYWLQHKEAPGFMALDGSNRNNDNVNIADPFTAAEKFADMTNWIRSLNNSIYPGASKLPIWWAKSYASPY